MSDEKDEIEGSIVLKTGSSEAHLPPIPSPILQALHNTITGPKESFTIARRRPAVVKPEDIQQLENIIVQWARPYNPISLNIQYFTTNSANDGISGHTRSKYASLKSFISKEPPRNEPITSTQISLSLLTRDLEENKLISIEATITLSGVARQYIHNASENDPLGLSYARHIVDEDRTFSTSVFYTDYVMAKGLSSVVDDWYKNLDNQQVWLPRRLFKLSEIEEFYDPFGALSHATTFFPPIIALILFSGALRYFEVNTQILQSNAILILSALIFTWATVSFSLKFPISRLMRQYGGEKVPLVIINSGDKKRSETYETDMRKKSTREKTWINSVYISFIVSLGAGILLHAFS